MTSGDGRAVIYSAYDKPVEILKGLYTTYFPLRPRPRALREVRRRPSGTTVATYIGGAFYEVESGPSGTKKKHYIAGVAVSIDTDGPGGSGSEAHYLLRDHLGSVETITDEAGAVIERTSFDATLSLALGTSSGRLVEDKFNSERRARICPAPKNGKAQTSPRRAGLHRTSGISIRSPRRATACARLPVDPGSEPPFLALMQPGRFLDPVPGRRQPDRPPYGRGQGPNDPRSGRRVPPARLCFLACQLPSQDCERFCRGR